MTRGHHEHLKAAEEELQELRQYRLGEPTVGPIVGVLEALLSIAASLESVLARLAPLERESPLLDQSIIPCPACDGQGVVRDLARVETQAPAADAKPARASVAAGTSKRKS